MPWIIDRDLTPQGKGRYQTSPTFTPHDDFRCRYQFRLIDGEGKARYYGRSTVPDVYAPLDDFGVPEGCIRIEYFNGKKGWYAL